MRSSALSWADYFGRHEFRIKGGYRMLSHPEYNAFAQEISGWDTPSVAAIQHASFRHLLDEFKAGMEAILGEGRCHVLSIRPEGGAVL